MLSMLSISSHYELIFYIDKYTIAFQKIGVQTLVWQNQVSAGPSSQNIYLINYIIVVYSNG
jgi:hypothetical protein